MAELKHLLQAAGLPTKGVKADLVQRLENHSVIPNEIHSKSGRGEILSPNDGRDELDMLDELANDRANDHGDDEVDSYLLVPDDMDGADQESMRHFS